jgi:hypothetical protein
MSNIITSPHRRDCPWLLEHQRRIADGTVAMPGRRAECDCFDAPGIPVERSALLNAVDETTEEEREEERRHRENAK